MSATLPVKALLNMPLDKGGHDNPQKGVCVMEMVSLLSQEQFSDMPTCTNIVITRAAQRVNDLLPNGDRQRLKALIPRLLRARRTENDKRINVRLAIWSAEQVLHLIEDDERRQKAIERIASARLWLDTGQRPAAADAAADAAAYAYAAAYAAADAAAYAAAYAAAAADAAADAAAAAAAAAYAAAKRSGDRFDPVMHLSDLLDAHEKALVEEGEDPWVPTPWEDAALEWAAEYAESSS